MQRTQPRHLCVRGFFPIISCIYIACVNAMGPHVCAHSSFNQHRNERGLCRNRRAEKEMIVIKTSKEVLKKRADARFRQEARALDGRKAMTEYEAQVLAIREKTARLRALRLATEAQAQNEEPPPKTKVRPLKNRGNR